MKNNIPKRLVYCLNSGLTTFSRSLQSTQDLEKAAHIGKN